MFNGVILMAIHAEKPTGAERAREEEKPNSIERATWPEKPTKRERRGCLKTAPTYIPCQIST